METKKKKEKKKRKVMVVDDDKEFLDEMVEILRLTGYYPVAASESVDVTEEIIQASPDIILLDLKMDKKSGFKVANELMSKPETKEIPIIAITGVFTHQEHSLLLKMCNIKDRLIKPINPLDVIHLIEKSIQ